MENGHQSSPITIDDAIAMERNLEAILLEFLGKNTPEIKKTVDALTKGIDKILKNQEILQRNIALLNQQKRDDAKVEVPVKKRKPTCDERAGPHRIFECPCLIPGEKFSHAIAADLCINCNNRHNGDCRRKAACTKWEKKHLTIYH
ncbi:hypothetical protein CAEBREN_16739 [Caenorhabditis brenneri]|uniref:Uncharacterized protein n=1 Tax=Caenorhabditis brenneri TaxID=135651 RepID=G0NX17_CAEBE|nr:hypothetical protein CAEBREN_16739 [Caenorhabditis brenneri]